LVLASPPQVINSVSNKTLNGLLTVQWLFSYIPAPNANGYTKIIFIIYDNYLAPSSYATVRIWIRPINDPPHFEVTVTEIPPQNINSSSDLENGPYAFKFQQVHDIDFYDDPITFSATSSSGLFYFAGNNPHAQSSCKSSNTLYNSSITCNLYFQQFLGFINQLTLSPEWDTSSVIVPNTTLSIYVTLLLNDLGNVDYRGAAYNLSCLRELNISKTFSPVLTAIVSEKPAATSFATVGAAVGIGIAIIAAVVVAFSLTKQKEQAETELARMLSNFTSAGDNVSPLYEPATVTVHSAVFRPAEVTL